MKIFVLNKGFVFVCRNAKEEDGKVHLTDARCVRAWGTTEGLGQLVSGPTSSTKLDAKIPIISAPLNQVLFSFDVTEAWEPHLK